MYHERNVADDITDALFELLKTKNLINITTTEIKKSRGVPFLLLSQLLPAGGCDIPIWSCPV